MQRIGRLEGSGNEPPPSGSVTHPGQDFGLYRGPADQGNEA